MTGKFSFLYVDIWFDVTECKFIMKNSSFKMLVVFSPIFVADTKIAFIYNSVAPLMFFVAVILTASDLYTEHRVGQDQLNRF